MCLIDGPDARVRIVIGIHAETEWLIIPKWCCLPMVAVMAEAVHSLGETFFFHACLFVLLSFLFA